MCEKLISDLCIFTFCISPTVTQTYWMSVLLFRYTHYKTLTGEVDNIDHLLTMQHFCCETQDPGAHVGVL